MIGALLIKRGVRHGFELLNQKDLAALSRLWAEDGVFAFPGETPISGRYEGQQAIAGFFRRGFNRMATIHFTVERIAVAHPFALGLTNTVLCAWALDETSHDGISIHIAGVSVFEFHHGRCVAARDYIFDPKPLEVMWGRREVGAAAAAVSKN
ncbi:MAG TPA: nuclear transport factor 2 family protein [Ktedonobacterales bacterium]